MNERADTIARKYGLDLIKLQFKTMMMGMLFGLFAPGGYTLLAYFLQNNRNSQEVSAQPGIFFWGLIAVSVTEVAIAFYLRKYWFSQPLIKAESTFASDFIEGVKRINIMISAFVHSLVLYGLMQFFMGADLQVIMLFAIFSVIAFQLLRFRGPLLEKALITQHEHVSAGRFLASKPKFS